MTSRPSKSAPKRKPSAFKPPRPASKSTKTVTPRRKSAPTNTIPSSSTSSDEDPPQEDSDSPGSVDPSSTQDPPPTIPPKLLTRLLHHHFEDDNTRISKEANTLVGKYMETFVRESIARAAFEKTEAEGGLGGDFLEVRRDMLPTWETNDCAKEGYECQVEYLEKLAPQLLLDF